MEDSSESRYRKNVRTIYRGSNGIYGLALIGALVYYIQHAATFWMGVLGVFKAILWPAFLIYDILDFLKA